MKGKYHWLVLCEQVIKIFVDQPVGMARLRLQGHQIDNVYDTDF